jgi:hypothetical protein
MAELGAGSGSSYPTSLDTNSVVEVDSPATGKTKVRANVPNDLAAAIIAIQTELGTDPAGTKTDVKTFSQVDHQTSGKHFHLITKSSDYTTVSSDNWGMFRVDTSSGNVVITLLASATAGDGHIMSFTNTSTNSLTLDPNGSETISGETSLLVRKDKVAIIECDGTNWHNLANNEEGGPSLGTNGVIRTNAKTIEETIVFAGTENGMTVGPVAIASTASVTVTSGSTWTIV